MDLTSLTKEQLKELRLNDFPTYNRIVAKKCYDTNEDYKEKKKAKMREYYYKNKEAMNAKYKEYRRDYYKIYREEKRLEKERLTSLHTQVPV